MKTIQTSAKWGTKTEGGVRRKDFDLDIPENIQDVLTFDEDYVLNCFIRGHKIAAQNKVRQTLMPKDPAAFARAETKRISEAFGAGEMTADEVVAAMTAMQQEISRMKEAEAVPAEEDATE